MGCGSGGARTRDEPETGFCHSESHNTHAQTSRKQVGKEKRRRNKKEEEEEKKGRRRKRRRMEDGGWRKVVVVEKGGGGEERRKNEEERRRRKSDHDVMPTWWTKSRVLIALFGGGSCEIVAHMGIHSCDYDALQKKKKENISERS